MLEYILLGFLNYQPKTGYELKSVMETSTSHFWHAYHSQIYTTLRRLEAEGLLESDLVDEDSKLAPRRYTITEAGRRKLLDWMNTPLDGLPQIKEEMLVRTFFSGPRPPAEVIDELRFQRQLHQRKLEEYRRMCAEPLYPCEPPATPIEREARFWNATLQFGVGYEELYLRWLDQTEAMVAGLPLIEQPDRAPDPA